MIVGSNDGLLGFLALFIVFYTVCTRHYALTNVAQKIYRNINPGET